MQESIILIIAKEKTEIFTDIIKKSKIDIIRLQSINKSIINKINTQYYEKYNFIFFDKNYNNINGLKNYLPIQNMCFYKGFINEVLINPIILTNIKNTIDKEALEIAILLKHIIRNEIEKEKFNFKIELEKIKQFNNYSSTDVNRLKNSIYKVIEKHYSQNKFFRIIKYKVNKNRIVNEFVYRLLRNIQVEIQHSILDHYLYQQNLEWRRLKTMLEELEIKDDFNRKKVIEYLKTSKFELERFKIRDYTEHGFPGAVELLDKNNKSIVIFYNTLVDNVEIVYKDLKMRSKQIYANAMLLYSEYELKCEKLKQTIGIDEIDEYHFKIIIRSTKKKQIIRESRIFDINNELYYVYEYLENLKKELAEE